ncbi:MAG TPA: hypothetical protein VL549_16220 [Gemmatimonadales bacterium]|nr:hypothetical protein [Gemmatimonadales bacterium]
MEDAPSGGIARRFAHQRGGQHPRALHAREIAVVRRASHVANAALRVAAAQPDQSREKTRQRARAREPVVVDAEPEITVGARRIGGEQAPVDVAHRFGVLRRAEAVPMLLALARAIAEGGRQPEISRARRQRAGARHRAAEQRIDPL